MAALRKQDGKADAKATAHDPYSGGASLHRNADPSRNTDVFLNIKVINENAVYIQTINALTNTEYGISLAFNDNGEYHAKLRK